jgi:DNA-directed RNA polymerase subunit RPC12/RpoP
MIKMKAICKECKNEIDLSRYPKIKKGMIIECNHCGITLGVTNIEGETVSTEIIDEGK